VDRTCLGVKNAFIAALHTDLDLARLVMDLGEQGDPLRPAATICTVTDDPPGRS
jgi:hypothetical protein